MTREIMLLPVIVEDGPAGPTIVSTTQNQRLHIEGDDIEPLLPRQGLKTLVDRALDTTTIDRPALDSLPQDVVNYIATLEDRLKDVRLGLQGRNMAMMSITPAHEVLEAIGRAIAPALDWDTPVDPDEDNNLYIMRTNALARAAHAAAVLRRMSPSDLATLALQNERLRADAAYLARGLKNRGWCQDHMPTPPHMTALVAIDNERERANRAEATATGQDKQ